MKGITMSEFKNHMITRLRKTLIVTLWCGIFFAVGYASFNAPQFINNPNSGATAMSVREDAAHSPEGVLNKHRTECWTMSQPALAEKPTAAIVQFKDGRAVYTQKSSLVDAALNEALAAIGYGDKTSEKIDVIALCL